MEASLPASCNIPSTKQVFVAQETLDHPFDVTLVVEDGKAFKAHKCVLSAASPFFQKLFKIDMRESNEGVVRLEMITELGLRDLLEFIYTGSVHISTEENAQELIEMADYLLLLHLKAFAGRVLLQMLNVSNCISMYYFAERYRCKELVSDIKKFIFVNFTTTAKTEQFLSLSSNEVKMWISSDEIEVSAEEDVFEIIITWASFSQKSERKKYFAELFRDVRLVYVSRDYLHRDVMTNDLVNSNDSCMDLVKDALKFIDCENNHHYSVTPRKSLDTPVIVVCMKYVGCGGQTADILCYYPREDKWSTFLAPTPFKIDTVTACRGKLYFLSQENKRILQYDLYSTSWRSLHCSLPLEERWTIHKLFVRNEDEIYAIVSKTRPCLKPEFALPTWLKQSLQRHLPLRTFSFIKKKPESNSWDRVLSFDEDSREDFCVVCSDNYIYFIGGTALRNGQKRILADVDRYDLISNTWDKIADIQEPRYGAYGAAGHGKIFIAGGSNGNIHLKNCEVYHEAANEWQFIGTLERWPTYLSDLLIVDSKLYLVDNSLYLCQQEKHGVIAYYDPDRNEWEKTTPIPLELIREPWIAYAYDAVCCPMRVYKECLDFFQHATTDEEAKNARGKEKPKCTVM